MGTSASQGTSPLRAEDIKPGTCTPGSVGDRQVAIFNVDGKLYATQANCTHAGGPLCEGALWGDTVICPWHGSEFKVTTGEIVEGPAEQPLATYKVTVENGLVVIEERA